MSVWMQCEVCYNVWYIWGRFKILNFWVVSGKVHKVLKFSMHELKGVLFVDSAVFQVNVLTQQREFKQSKSRNR